MIHVLYDFITSLFLNTTIVWIGVRPGGNSSIIEVSKSAYTVIAKVLGNRRCRHNQLVRIIVIFQLPLQQQALMHAETMLAPSIITNDKSWNSTSSWNNAWVPTIIFTDRTWSFLVLFDGLCLSLYQQASPLQFLVVQPIAKILHVVRLNFRRRH